MTQIAPQQMAQFIQTNPKNLHHRIPSSIYDTPRPQTGPQTAAQTSGGLSVYPQLPKPSQIFTSAMERFKQSARQFGNPTLSTSSPQIPFYGPPSATRPHVEVSSVPRTTSVEAISQHLKPPSATQLKEFQRKARALARRQQTLVSSTPKQAAATTGLKRKLTTMAEAHLHTNLPISSSAVDTPKQTILDSMKHMIFTPQDSLGSHPTMDQMLVSREIDEDVARAVVYVTSKCIGLEPQALAHSVGLRRLVSRNMQWFHHTNDWVKMVSLVLAKKLTSFLDPSGSLQLTGQELMTSLDSTYSDETPLDDAETGPSDQVLEPSGSTDTVAVSEEDSEETPPEADPNVVAPSAPLDGALEQPIPASTTSEETDVTHPTFDFGTSSSVEKSASKKKSSKKRALDPAPVSEAEGPSASTLHEESTDSKPVSKKKKTSKTKTSSSTDPETRPDDLQEETSQGQEVTLTGTSN